MSRYRVFETEAYQRELARIASSAQKGMQKKLRQHVYPKLREQPYFGPHLRKLRAWKPDTWRYRIGSWRLFYEVDEKARIVSMTAVEHRPRAYRR